MKHTIIANWKMYIEKPDAAKRFLVALKRRSQLLSKFDLIIAPPFTLLSVVGEKRGSLKLGAQTLSRYAEAKHTGEISATMLKSIGATHVIVGHSERRAAGEMNEHIRSEVERAEAAGLTTILCVGESERDPAGAYFTFIQEQLTSALKVKSNPKLMVAYEPVWAIGKTAADAMKPAELQEMVIFIRKTLVNVLGRAPALKVPILYGGSVEGENAAELMREGGVAGFLVGHASTDAQEFIKILTALK